MHKAYNGRVLAAYFSEVAQQAAERRLSAPGPGRIFGVWLEEQVGKGLFGDYLLDPKLPLQAACMTLALHRFRTMI